VSEKQLVCSVRVILNALKTTNAGANKIMSLPEKTGARKAVSLILTVSSNMLLAWTGSVNVQLNVSITQPLTHVNRVSIVETIAYFQNYV